MTDDRPRRFIDLDGNAQPPARPGPPAFPAARADGLPAWAPPTMPPVLRLTPLPPKLPTAGTDFRTLLRPVRGNPLAQKSEAQRAIAARHRTFKAIECRRGVFLSIQASEFHACQPRETLDDLAAYDAWEIAAYAAGGMWAAVDEFDRLWNGNTVAGFVPTRDVQAVFDALILGADLIPIENTIPEDDR